MCSHRVFRSTPLHGIKISSLTNLSSTRIVLDDVDDASHGGGGGEGVVKPSDGQHGRDGGDSTAGGRRDSSDCSVE